MLLLIRPLTVFMSVTLSLAVVRPAAAADGEPAKLRAFVAEYCYDCHDTATKKQGFDVEALPWSLGNRAAFDAWGKVYDKVATGEMPPKKKSKVTDEERSAFTTALHDALLNYNKDQQAAQGRVVLRRLNRVEWENTVHDLLGVDLPLKQMLPEDTPLHGFDTVAEGLRLSALHMEKYLEAADAAIADAVILTEEPERKKERFTYKEEKSIRENLDTAPGTIIDPVSKAKHTQIFRELDDAVVFFSDGYSPTDLRQFRSRYTGEYRIRISAYGWQTRGRTVGMRINAHRFRGPHLLAYFDIPPDKPREVEAIVHIDQGEVLQITPFGTGYDENGRGVWNIGGEKYNGVGLAVQWIEIEGPLHDTWPPKSVRNLFGDTPLREVPQNKRRWKDGKQVAYELAPPDERSAIRPVIERFASRAFRRPIESGEVDGFVALANQAMDDGDSYQDALCFAFRAILTSPRFLLLEEHPGKLSDYALASRLSYFLWSSMPDDELLRLARERKLSDPAVLHAQVERMLSAPKAAAFATNFVGQWLDLRSIEATSPDMRLYPEFDEILKMSMIGETEAFFNEMLRKDLAVSNFIQSDFVMINRRLAEHYGIDGVNREEYQRVALPPDSPRGGVLTQASVLKVTANGTVTSPVMRGAWVMKRILGEPPPPPPANVGAIEPDTRGATTIREQLAKHRTIESCAGCHVRIDPPGFALESFDVIGGWRDHYRSKEIGAKPAIKFQSRDIWEYKLGPSVDASGEMPDGSKFDDVRQFKQLLLAQEPKVARNVAEKMLIYATGAGIQFADREVVDDILKQTADKQHGLRSLVHAVVACRAFQYK